MRRPGCDGLEQCRLEAAAPGDHPPPEVQTLARPTSSLPHTAAKPEVQKKDRVRSNQSRRKDVIGAEVSVHDPTFASSGFGPAALPSAEVVSSSGQRTRTSDQVRSPALEAALRAARQLWTCPRHPDRGLRLAARGKDAVGGTRSVYRSRSSFRHHGENWFSSRSAFPLKTVRAAVLPSRWAADGCSRSW